jgi:hypothetical protein
MNMSGGYELTWEFYQRGVRLLNVSFALDLFATGSSRCQLFLALPGVPLKEAGALEALSYFW